MNKNMAWLRRSGLRFSSSNRRTGNTGTPPSPAPPSKADPPQAGADEGGRPPEAGGPKAKGKQQGGLFRRFWKRKASGAARPATAPAAGAHPAAARRREGEYEDGTVSTKDITFSTTHSLTSSPTSSLSSAGGRPVYFMDISPGSGPHESLLSDMSTDDDEDRSDVELLFQAAGRPHGPEEAEGQPRKRKGGASPLQPPKLLRLRRSPVSELTCASCRNADATAHRRHRRESASSNESGSTLSSLSAGGRNGDAAAELFGVGGRGRRGGGLTAIPDNSIHSTATDCAASRQRPGNTAAQPGSAVRESLERRTAASLDPDLPAASAPLPSSPPPPSSASSPSPTLPSLPPLQVQDSIDSVLPQDDDIPASATPMQVHPAPTPSSTLPNWTPSPANEAPAPIPVPAPAAEEGLFRPSVGFFHLLPSTSHRDLSYIEDGLSVSHLPSDLSIDMESITPGVAATPQPLGITPMLSDDEDAHHDRIQISTIDANDEMQLYSDDNSPPSVVGSSCTSSTSYPHRPTDDMLVNEHKSPRSTANQSRYHFCNADLDQDFNMVTSNDETSDDDNSEQATLSSYSAGMTHLEELYSDIFGVGGNRDGERKVTSPYFSSDSDLSTLGLFKDDKSCHSSEVSFDSIEFLEDECCTQQMFLDDCQKENSSSKATSCSISMHDITTIHEEEENEDDVEEDHEIQVGWTNVTSSSLPQHLPPHLLNGELHIRRQELRSQGTTTTGTFSSVTDDSYLYMSYDSLSLLSERGSNTSSPQRSTGHNNDLSDDPEDYANAIKPILKHRFHNDPKEFTLKTSRDSVVSDSECSYESFSSKSVKYMLGILKEENNREQKSNIPSESVKYMLHTLKEETERRRSKIKGRLSL